MHKRLAKHKFKKLFRDLFYKRVSKKQLKTYQTLFKV